jgi:hypothetical protein
MAIRIINNNYGGRVSISSRGLGGKFNYAVDPVKIVSSGLVLNLDAGNTLSYPGTGTTWTDLSGNSNNGTLVNGPTYSSTNGGSIVFDGTNDYVNCGNNILINPPALTYCAWIKGNAFTNAYNSIISKAEEPPTNVATLLIKSNGKLALYVYGNGIVFYDGSGIYTLSVSNWYHLCLTYSSADGLKGYVNGNLDGSASANGSINSQTSTLYIASHPTITGRNFNGSVSNAQIYNRALTITEIQRNYNADKNRFGL